MALSRRACLLVLMALVASTKLAHAELGVDVSDAVVPSQWQCLNQGGYSFAVIRCWCSFGNVDTNCPHTIYNAQAAGVNDIDVYLFPCAGQSASAQVNSMYSYLDQFNATDKYGTIWMDIETNPSRGCGWGSDTGSNCQFIAELLSAAANVGKRAGIYASQYMWSQIAGSDCTVGAQHPLWYAHYDGNPSFSDFRPFGGWSHPTIKQYADSGAGCGVGADLNFKGSESRKPHH
jgi:GH25 family lysozyme M1 (1,4-beta-N-acetylmuramidase)